MKKLILGLLFFAITFTTSYFTTAQAYVYRTFRNNVVVIHPYYHYYGHPVYYTRTVDYVRPVYYVHPVYYRYRVW